MVATELRLPDGTRAVTWPLEAGDRTLLAEAYEGLSDESKRHRFLTGVPHLTDAMLDRLLGDIDGAEHVALVLFVFDEDSVGTPVAVSHMVRYDDDPTAVDVAVTVDEEHRGRGVATALLKETLRQRPPGVTRIVTQVAADNPASLALLRHVGRTLVGPVHGNTVRVDVELNARERVDRTRERDHDGAH